MSIIFLTYTFYEIPNSITYFHYFLIYRYSASLFPLDKMYTRFVAYITPLQSTLTTKMPYVVNYCRIQLLFVFWYYWPAHSTGYGYSVDAFPASFSAGQCAYAASASCFSCRLMSVSIFFGSYAVSLAFLTQNHYIYV